MEAQESSWESIRPKVNSEAEFSEIAGDFGNPLEIVREALSNAFDAGATRLRVLFDVQQIDGAPTSVIEFEDNGSGMSAEVVRDSFWGLGFSTSRDDEEKIGEKGHGTKIFLRSEEILVRTQTDTDATESICERPMRSLGNGKLHEPRIRSIDKWRDSPGTLVRVIGYNGNVISNFSRDLVRDYLYWFTKFGSVEKLVGRDTSRGMTIELKCLNEKEPEICQFGHIFPAVNDDGDKLLKEYGGTLMVLAQRRVAIQVHVIVKVYEITVRIARWRSQYMTEAVTAKQLIQHLSPYDLDRVTFQMADGLPVVAIYVDTDKTGGVVITISDELPESASA